MIVAPPSAHATPWSRKFGPQSTALASGWMRIRGARRRRSVDRGFVLSDHADELRGGTEGGIGGGGTAGGGGRERGEGGGGEGGNRGSRYRIGSNQSIV